MSSPNAERAVSEALRYGSALLKFVSANDVGLTGSHQAGFLLPRAAWELYTPHSPTKGRVDKHPVRVQWQDDRVTDSVVTWYGDKTRSEYRLTRFGKDFPFRTADDLGSLLVLIPKSLSEFSAFILDTDSDIQDIQTSLGVEVVPGRGWAAFRAGREQEETPDECVDRHFRQFAGTLQAFPTGQQFSQAAISALKECLKDFATLMADERLVRCIDAEYKLFRLVERQVCGPEICRMFHDIDDFLKLANSILNRRKSRAGRALENHVEVILKDAGIPFDMRAEVTGEPDILIPGRAAYDDPAYPADRLFVVGVKTTCKDRWRQVIEEAPRVTAKHILTLQPGISATQLRQMHDRHVTLVVPEALHRQYPKDSGISLLTVDAFLTTVKGVMEGRAVNHAGLF